MQKIFISINNIMNTILKKIKKDNKGFVILFSAVISMIILLISSSMYTMSKKQTILSSYARESQKAFYVANSALECAFYHDISDYLTHGSFFPLSAGDNYEEDINCGGRMVRVKKLDSTTGSEGYDHSFVFRYPNSNNIHYYDTGCAYVLVEKKVVKDDDTGDQKIKARVTAVGYNRCKEGDTVGVYDIPDFDDPTLLERRISAGYETVYYGN